tara:strand:- start:191 stop:676 length:486 start_codon:yes stop_codon:yes gene_type:complete
MSSIQEKAFKWDSLIKWIKATASDDDSDVWEKLEELGVNASGGVEVGEEYECEQCSVKVKTEKDLTITYGCMDMKFCEDCYKTSKDCVKEEEEEDRLCPCGDGYKESGCPDGCSGGCCISCCRVGEEKCETCNRHYDECETCECPNDAKCLVLCNRELAGI